MRPERSQELIRCNGHQMPITVDIFRRLSMTRRRRTTHPSPSVIIKAVFRAPGSPVHDAAHSKGPKRLPVSPLRRLVSTRVSCEARQALMQGRSSLSSDMRGSKALVGRVRQPWIHDIRLPEAHVITCALTPVRAGTGSGVIVAHQTGREMRGCVVGTSTANMRWLSILWTLHSFYSIISSSPTTFCCSLGRTLHTLLSCHRVRRIRGAAALISGAKCYHVVNIYNLSIKVATH